MPTSQRHHPYKLLSISVLLFCALIVCPLAAQDKSGPASQASTDSASVAQDKVQTGEVAPEDRVIRKRSLFFPDLATNRTPLSADQKFRLAMTSSVAPAAFLGSAFGAGINQATNTPSGYGQGAEGYGKRFGSSMATRATKNIFGNFVIATIARQDPRFFVHGRGTFGARFGHAISRVVVAPKDRGGYGFNWGGVFGPLGSEAFANTYQPVREQTGARTMQRYGIDLLTTAGANIMKEFWPDIFKHLGMAK